MVCGASVGEKGRFDVDSARLRKAAERENGAVMVDLICKPAIGTQHSRVDAERGSLAGVPERKEFGGADRLWHGDAFSRISAHRIAERVTIAFTTHFICLLFSIYTFINPPGLATTN